MTNITVAYQGVPGSYSYQAMNEYFDDKINSINTMLFSDVFESVESGESDFGILPFENSTTGGVYEVFDLLANRDLFIVGERCIEVKHHLMCIPGSSLDRIHTVYSHQQALDQCSRFIRDHKITPIPTTNTAVSAQLVREKQDPGLASIGSLLAAKLNELDILSDNINNYSNNITKFIILSKTRMPSENANKLSLFFTTPHKPGALYTALGYFARENINLLKLISRPAKNTPWAYSYFVDVEGNMEDPAVARVLELLKKNSPQFKILGNYVAHNLEV
ncbi:prephenate dehydratase [Alkalibacter rhizosphaerae]|uniref:Prephenate dehydratase n=1 Tax=Alkalibacter rhizosphaerae TaxID=2815577 RepID=A0A974XLV6_9FIRM|nr:prephenate dehydratase [Alkalibacter rhizosphaerae]QSX08341.1 prephenate dehydratase [Alkalibacter rhizosphaerae]